MTKLELIQRAIEIANHGQTTPVTAVSTEGTAEALLPVIFGEVSGQLASTRQTRTMLMRTQALSVVNGEVELDEEVLTDYLGESILKDPADNTKRYSLAPWDQFVQGLDQRLGHYAVKGESTLSVVEPNTLYDPTSGPTIDLDLTTPCAVAVPTGIGDAIDAREEVVEVLLKSLAEALKLRIYARR